MDAPALERGVQLGDAPRPVLVWRFPEPVRAIATTVMGGGLGHRSWALNAEVPLDYHEANPADHAARIADDLGLQGAGIGFLTAARVLDVVSVVDDDASCDATVGISTPTWAAAPDGSWSRWTPGTINLVCWVPAPLSDAALANALVSATEAKAQALFEAAVPGTGTASDAVAVCCPPGGSEPYGGPRSPWGARLARAVHGAVSTGAARFLAGRS
jgi:adenosylcobinamide hydrolase